MPSKESIDKDFKIVINWDMGYDNMGTVTVVDKCKVLDHIYCGRGSALGNIFVMHSEHNRDEVCDQYEAWFYKKIDETMFFEYVENPTQFKLSPAMKLLLDIFNQAKYSDVNLGCFCAPRRCHCDTIKHFIDNKLEELDK